MQVPPFYKTLYQYYLLSSNLPGFTDRICRSICVLRTTTYVYHTCKITHIPLYTYVDWNHKYRAQS